MAKKREPTTIEAERLKRFLSHRGEYPPPPAPSEGDSDSDTQGRTHTPSDTQEHPQPHTQGQGDTHTPPSGDAYTQGDVPTPRPTPRMRRVNIYLREDQIEWLDRMAEAAGDGVNRSDWVRYAVDDVRRRMEGHTQG